jgi:hypothetical protein
MVYRLLEGSEEEIPPQVRKGVYDALRCIVKHIPANTVNDALTPACEMVIRAFVDKDRTVRLVSG